MPEDDLARLENGPIYKFSDWPNPLLPRKPGVYTIWDSGQFIYVGMAGRGVKADAVDEPKKTNGLWGRLDSHRRGGRSGDQFCVYVCDRFIVPAPTPEQQEQIGAGELSLDDLTRDRICERYEYRFVATPDEKTARALEREVQHGALSEVKPYLNPLPAVRRRSARSRS